MVEYTRPATWSDLVVVARYLDEAGMDYALVGGYAIAAHGFNRFSEDIDVMPAACGHSWEELCRYIEDIDIDGGRIKVLSLEGLLLTKEGMRDRDRADARVLREAIARLGGSQK